MASVRVILYGHRGCPGTAAALDYFRQRGLAHTYRDVSRDPLAMAELRALGGVATPLLRVGERVLIGFDPDRFRAAYSAGAGGEGAGDSRG